VMIVIDRGRVGTVGPAQTSARGNHSAQKRALT
jgi:hypothetical protein